MNKPDIWIGARGWRHESWIGEFYPDDMPNEWGLSYYSNEFDCVLVPWSYLRDSESEPEQTWMDDTRDGFEFFLELPVSASKHRVEKALHTLKPRLGGLLITDLNPQHLPFAAEAPLVEWMDIAKSYAPIAVNWDSLAVESMPIAQQHKLGRYWRPEEKTISECNCMGIAEISSSNKHDPKAIKKIIEDCRSVQGPTTIGLFFGGDTPSIEEMRNAIMILQMLG